MPLIISILKTFNRDYKLLVTINHKDQFPEDMTIVLVGDTKKIEQQIKEYEKKLLEMNN